VTPDGFVRHYHPQTRLLLIGEGYELEFLSRTARSANLPVVAIMTAPAGQDAVRQSGAEVFVLDGRTPPPLPVDPFTAIVFLLHDRFKEAPLLKAALEEDPFYLGALGSRRTQAARFSRMTALGVEESRLAKLRGPIGLFGPTRAASSLAVSVLAEVMEARSRLDG
jgi:xanthine dehydrogenase accessory factor